MAKSKLYRMLGVLVLAFGTMAVFSGIGTAQAEASAKSCSSCCGDNCQSCCGDKCAECCKE